MSKNTTPIQTLSSKLVYESTRLSVYEDKVKFHQHSTASLYVHASLMPGVTVLPIAADGDVWLVREYKYALQRFCIEAMSGGIDSNEHQLTAAKRELQEELGFTAKTWEEHGVVNPFTSTLVSPNYMYIARDIESGPPSHEIGEFIEPIKMPLQEAVAMVMRSEILHGASSLLILKAAYLQLSAPR